MEAATVEPVASAAALSNLAGPASKANGGPGASSVRAGDSVLGALSLSVGSLVRAPSKEQEEGVVVARAMASSRGGYRSTLATSTPTAVPTPTPVPKRERLKPVEYEVVSGDTLLGIAYRFGITPETVLWANDLGNGELLQIGQKLTILPVSGVLHRVKAGDTLGGIAEAYGADVGKLVEANGLGDADLLREGEELVVPGGMLRTTEPIVGLPARPSEQELAAAPRYQVREGDTLLSIADAWGVRASVIQVANELLDPDKLRVGQELVIPGGKRPSGVRPAAPVEQRPAPQPQAAKPEPAPPPPPPPPPPAPAGGKGDQIVTIAQQYLGYRYVWGGTSPSTGFDCSGFVWYVYKQAGVSIPRAPLESQLGAGPRISMDKLQPGDLVFWQNTYKAGLSHVGIYLGGGRFINAESEAVGVQIRSLSDPFWAARYVGASRPW